MFYYLEEHTSKCIIVISDDIYLINNISTGLLDCNLKFTENKNAADRVAQHLLDPKGIGITINQDNPTPVSLKNFESTVEKLRLAMIRKPCFEKLLKCINTYSLSNNIGFQLGDEQIITYALTDNRALEEYAEVQNISSEFAKKELTLISQSVLRDRFRVFTVSTLLKNKINQITNETDVPEILELINKSFTLYGIVDV
jgi:hypothetical protein